jgi:aminopeptidase N
MFASGILKAQFTKGDSLRGSITPERAWWDVIHYDLRVNINISGNTISGSNCIAYVPLTGGTKMQIDLQEPLKIDSVFFHSQKCTWKHTFNAWIIDLPQNSTSPDSVLVFYSGKPRAAKFPPWDGGISWKQDAMKRTWLGVSCQGLGASVWWPNKDHQYDEPDQGMIISITIPDSLVNISNGKLVSVTKKNNNTATWTYKVLNPINNYDVTFNVGNYVTVKDSFMGKNGKLNMEYVVLDYNKDKIASHLVKDTRDMLTALEYWFGPYPFYEDGYRLVQTPYLGMEHQSAIAYGNNFKKGYMGIDRSKTSVGLLFDFIIIHESGHEWFGNNITCKDNADMWIHEGFTTYSEYLFMEYHYGKDTADMYIIGQRKNILNDVPVIGNYNVNKEGSSDQYDKGSNMIHTIRQVINNDSLFHRILLGLNKDFAKKTVTTKEIEDYMIAKSGKDLQPIFDQYLRSTTIPALEYELKKGKLVYRWNNCNKNFNMPVRILLNSSPTDVMWIFPSIVKKEITVSNEIKAITADSTFYVKTKPGFAKVKK